MKSNQLLIKDVGGLYGIAIKRLHQLKPSSNGIIRFPEVFSKLCSSFSIPKSVAWDLLFILENFGFIEIIRFHGIKLCEKTRGGKE